MIKAVIFDHNGVLSQEKENVCEKDIAKAYSVRLDEIKKELRVLNDRLEKGAISEDVFWKEFSLKIKKPLPLHRYFLWRRAFLSNLKLNFQIFDLNNALRKQGLKTAVLSNTIEPQAMLLKQLHAYETFDAVVLSYEVKMIKPEKAMYLYTLQELRVKPSECLFIDDIKENVEAAKRLGIESIHAISPQQVIKEVNKVLEY